MSRLFSTKYSLCTIYDLLDNVHKTPSVSKLGCSPKNAESLVPFASKTVKTHLGARDPFACFVPSSIYRILLREAAHLDGLESAPLSIRNDPPFDIAFSTNTPPTSTEAKR